MKKSMLRAKLSGAIAALKKQGQVIAAQTKLIKDLRTELADIKQHGLLACISPSPAPDDEPDVDDNVPDTDVFYDIDEPDVLDVPCPDHNLTEEQRDYADV